MIRMIVGSFTIFCVLMLSACREESRGDSPGSSSPDQREIEAIGNLRQWLHASLAAGNRRIVIPQGRYALDAQKGSHLSFNNLTDVEIVAEGVELVCTSPVRAILFENCTNVTLRGLVIDYDPLPFSQGRIIDIAPDRSWVDFEIARGYPENGLAGPFQIYDPATAMLRRGDARWGEEIQYLGGSRYRVSKALPYRHDPATDTERIGDILVAKCLHGIKGPPHAVELRRCRNLHIEGITIYSSPSFGFLERGCHGTHFIRCTIDRRLPENDCRKRELPRMRSLNADAFHSKDALKGPSIISCRARFMGDDAVNINGRFHFIRSCKGREVRIAIIDRTTTIHQGDSVQFLPFSGPRPRDAKVISRRVDQDGFSTEERARIHRLRIDERMRQDLLGNGVQFFVLTLDREVSVPPGSALCCAERLGNGFIVRDCDFGFNRSRGILIKASQGKVIGNRIFGSRMHAILVSPEYWWMEAGLSSDLVIKDNHIRDCLETPIQILARSGNREILPAGALRNISILQNRIESSAWPLIHVTSTSELEIKDNILPDAPPKVSGRQTPDPVVVERSRTR